MSTLDVMNPVEPFLRTDRMPHIWCPGCGIGTTVNCFARALIESKAVDLEVVGKVLGQFGARAAMSGETIGAIIGRRCWDICIPPEPYGVNVAEIAGAANR